MKPSQVFKTFLFFLEISSFFISGFFMANGNKLIGGCTFGVGFILAFIVGNMIYKEGKK